MTLDPALDWLLDDARRQGLSTAEYERRYGVILAEGAKPSAAAQRIRRHEISAGVMGTADLAIAQLKERRRDANRPAPRPARAR